MKYLNFALIVALGAFIYFQDLPMINFAFDSIDVDDNNILRWNDGLEQEDHPTEWSA